MLPIYVALDLETTGIDAERDAIIEIGALKFRGDEVLDEFSVLINPGRPVPPEITALTGIRDQDLIGAPRLHDVLTRLSRFVGDRVVVGHSVGFDLAFLRRWSTLSTNRSLDTFQLATMLAPEAQRYSLSEVASTLGFPPAVSHRALDDSRTAQLLLLALLGRAAALPRALLEELIRHGERIDWPECEFFRLALQEAGPEPFRQAGQQWAAQRAQGDERLPFAVPPAAPPLEPAEMRRLLDAGQLAALLEADGAFTRCFPAYEHRPQQVDMLLAVAQALNDGHHLMVEAPTGVGKSLAYLIPAVHWAVQNDERVVVSTNTINLQEQLYRKDLPDLAQALPLPFRATVLKGRSHYLCPARLDALRRVGPSSPEEMEVLGRVLVWLPHTVDGDGDGLFLPTTAAQAVWRQLSAEHDACNPEHCRHWQQRKCFFYRAREAAEAGHLVIVNHALLLADVAVENRALPDYRFLIVDEAHHLEAATTHGLSFETRRSAIHHLLEEAGSGRGGAFSGLLGQTATLCRRSRLDPQVLATVDDFMRQLARAVERAARGLGDLFDHLEECVASMSDGQNNSGYATQLRVTPAQRVQPAWERVEVAWDNVAVPLFAVADGLQRLAEGLEDLIELGLQDAEGLQVELTSLGRELAEVHGHLNVFVTQPSHQTIYWVEAGPASNGLSLHAAPLHVGPLVEEHLFHKKEVVILTSATLRTAGSFDFLRERLQAWDADELAVDSPFDYASSTLVYIVDDIAEPGQAAYQRALEQGMLALFRATRGRALGLFTSYSQLRATARAVTAPLAHDGITVYAQGQGLSRNQLLESFRTGERAVLLGTRSFWEGIDVPGEALSCLAIAKLPFSVPSDPIFAARSETFDDAFLEYAVPDAVLRFLQGFGRLIRTRTDRGVVVIFDRRVVSKSYGRFFIESLPGPTVRRGPLTMLPQAAADWLDESA